MGLLDLYLFISLYIGPVANWKYGDTKDLNVHESFEHLCRTHGTMLWGLGAGEAYISERGENVNIFIVVEVSHQGRVLKAFRGSTPGQLIPMPSVTTRREKTKSIY